MTRLELRRADLGFGRVVIDERGVTRTGLVGATSLAWDEIDAYRLAIRLRGAAPDLAYGLGVVGAIVTARDVVRGVRGQRTYRCELALAGGGRALRFGWRFRDADTAIARVLARLGPAADARARAALDRHGAARFGPLAVGPDALGWRGHAIARGTIARLALFDSSPVSLRIVARDGRVVARAPTARVPDLIAALDLAEALGYPVAGRDLLAAVTPGLPADA